MAKVEDLEVSVHIVQGNIIEIIFDTICMFITVFVLSGIFCHLTNNIAKAYGFNEWFFLPAWCLNFYLIRRGVLHVLKKSHTFTKEKI